MNLFELSFFLSLLLGGISGAIQGNKEGIILAIIGFIAGALIGAGLHYLIVFIVSIAATRFKLDKTDRLNIFQWIISMLSVLFIGICPFLAFHLVNIIAKIIYHMS